jgi:hypothetical protein
MDRERQALVAFAVLAALVVIPIALTAAAASPVHRGPAATGSMLRLPAGCGRVAPPVFPGARAARGVGNEAAILRQLNGLGRTEPLTDLATFTMGRTGWLADSRTGVDVIRWYDRRLRSIPIWRMGPRLRSLIGMRPRGSVDSPPVLYVTRPGAVLIRQIGEDRMGLLVAASCSGTQTA